MNCFKFVGFIALFLQASIFADETYQYVLDTGDTLKIQVFEEEDLSFDIKIDESGAIDYPYLGKIQLIGKTTQTLEQEIHDGLVGRVLIKPNISVILLDYRTISIGGEVEKPGSYPWEPDLNIKKAINLAGGVTEWATGTRFEVDRGNPERHDEKDLEPESAIYPGDTVTVLPRRF